MGVEEKLKQMGLAVKEPSGPRGKLAPAVRTGNLVFTSGNTSPHVVKLLGMVNCAEGFYDTPSVIHGATDLLLELFGPEAGWHARSAVGLYQLPGNCAVEIELIVEVR